MATLSTELRKTLEKTVIKARDLAEVAVRTAVQAHGVGFPKPPPHLDDEGRKLRNHLRAHGRQLGDHLHGDDRQDIGKLIQEGAYEHWHRMLFARFLAENGLLLHPELGVGVTLPECEELAQEEGCNAWELAGRYASRMLPQIFRPEDPVLRLRLAPEHQQALEILLADLPNEVFTADDSLGWVYQFWQAKRKDEVNASEVKIGADELPAVTQLFTEDYMVDFLLHNSLGGWWATRHPGEPCPVPLTYLRTLADGTPAAGKFEGWPDSLKDFTLLDPCCGSGHFLVAAFRLLVALRRADENLTTAEAVDAVLSQNLHGLELDARCVEIAVFALALAAWTTTGEDGHPLGVRAGMPSPAMACCGLKVAAKVEDWLALVPENHPDSVRLKAGLKRLYETFQQAPLLGSLLNPRHLAGDLFSADYDQLQDLLNQALSVESSETTETAITAKGLMEASRLLGRSYNLVITNVPYLGRGDQVEDLKCFCSSYFSIARNDLANVFLERCLELSQLKGKGVVQIVMPQNWLFLSSYKKHRISLLKRVSWNLLARLGPGAFETITGEVVQAILLTQTNMTPRDNFKMLGIDASESKVAAEKAKCLREDGALIPVSQQMQLKNPDAKIILSEGNTGTLLNHFAKSNLGICTGDYSRFGRSFWEIRNLPNEDWEYQQTSAGSSQLYGGMSQLLFWEKGKGQFFKYLRERLGDEQVGSWVRGGEALGKKGITISATGSLSACLYLGTLFDNNVSVVIPTNSDCLKAIWCYLSSPSFHIDVRAFNQQLKITDQSFVEVVFDASNWQEVANERYPDGIPKPFSGDPNQWIFHGNPCPSNSPLQVAVARLLGYRWPAETDADMELSDEARFWINRNTGLESLVELDGLVPIPPMRGKQPAEERLRQMLAAAFGTDWSPSTEQELLQAVGCGGKSLEVWLRDGFFEQHCKLFHQRPFIWQLWDGLRDGFSVLVNAHKLDRKGLEALTYSYLGDWINRQKDAAAHNKSGAQGKVEKAMELQKKLVEILEGEAPYDIFVRWKPLEQQPIGWEPDLNDGVRLNIRPFMIAGVLRKAPKINWNKDRGTDVKSAPWYCLGPEYGGKLGDRINDHHLSLEAKRAARVSTQKS